MAALAESPEQRSWLSTLVRHWAQVDLAAASAWAEALPAAAKRSRLLASVAGVIAEDAPHDAIAFAETLAGNARRQAIASALNAWAAQDPSAALAALDEMADHAVPAYLKQQIVRHWVRQNARAAWEWAVSQSPSPSRVWLLRMPLGMIAQTDPLEAIALARGLRGRERRDAMAGALGTWASNDARAAANWAARADDVDPRERDDYLRYVLDVWGGEDASAALAWVEASSLSSGTAVSAVARQYAARSPRQALDWVLSQPLAVQRQAIAGVVIAWARDAPQAASRAVARIRDDQIRASGQNALASTWGDADPNRALRWAVGLADADRRSELTSRVLRRWANYDAQAAATYVRRVRDAGRRDAMALTLIESQLPYNEPDVAEELYGYIRDPEVQRKAATMLRALFQNRYPERVERYRAAAGD